MKNLVLPLLLTSSMALATPSLPLVGGKWVVVNNTGNPVTVRYTNTHFTYGSNGVAFSTFGQLNLGPFSSNVNAPINTPFHFPPNYVYNPNPLAPYQTFNVNDVSWGNNNQPFDNHSCAASYRPSQSNTYVFTLSTIAGSNTLTCSVSSF